MEKPNKAELTALLAAISVSTGIMAGQPAVAVTNDSGMAVAEKSVNLEDAEKKDDKKDDKKADEGKKEGDKKKGGKSRTPCNYPCGCHYGVQGKKHGKKDGAKAPEKKDEKPKEGGDAEKK